MKSRRDGGVENKNKMRLINELKEKAKLASTEMEKLRRENERLMGLREEERLQWEGQWNQKETETNKWTETQEIEGRLHGKDGVEDAHTHTHRGSGGQWGRAHRACWDPVRAAG